VTTTKQLLANRANAKQSTGPRSQEGKTRSRANAWKHGLSAKEIIMVGEKSCDFDALRAELWQQLQPASGLETVLVDGLAVLGWRLRRPAVYEAACLRDPFKILDEKFGIQFDELRKLALVSRYETALMNNFHRTMQQLLALQDRRRMQEEEGRTVDVLPEPEERNAA
jgi:hypothetical protein